MPNLQAIFASFLLVISIPSLAAQNPLEADVCVYGATAGGVAAAVQAARLHRSVILLEPGKHIGGMTSGGLGQTDIGNKAAIGGISREFYKRAGAHYGKDESWIFEPHVAENILFEMINEAKVCLFLEQQIAEVIKINGRITLLKLASGRTIAARMFIDASYEGDLMSLAGISYAVGREDNARYGETLNGIRAETPKHQFVVGVDPFVRAGDSASGLLPFIQKDAAGKPGTGDKSVQAYNFRLVLTKNKDNFRPIEPPPNYDPQRYELLARYLEAWNASAKRPSLGQLMHIQMMPNGKTDINNNGGFSTDYIGADYDYPQADEARRAAIWHDHEDYTRGFLHFLATNPRVPESIRQEMQSWGLTRDEFLDTGGWPHQLYIREARRMVSDYVMTEHNCRGEAVAADSVGLAAYTMDSHNCRRIVVDGRVANEGDVQVGGFPPYPISYRSLIPKRSECENLLVPVCLSATHIAYGSIRMEPVFMVLGHSAAVAANLALKENCSLQDISMPQLEEELRADKQILIWTKK